MKRILICVLVVFCMGCARPIIERQPVIPKIINYDLGIDAQLESLARQVAIQLGDNRCGHVGMKGFFDVNGRTRRLEKYVEIELTNRLLRIGPFKIHAMKDLARAQTSEPSLLRDAEFSVNPNTYNADDLDLDSYIVGSTVEFPQGVKINVKIIEAKTGFVFGTASIMVHRDKIVESLLDNFGERKYPGFGNSSFRVGEIIKTGENQYVDLVPGEYILYVKQINFQYALFSDSFSNVELFLNEDFRVMSVNDMISINYGNERYILSLRDVANGVAVFTFARLNDGYLKPTETFSLLNKAPYSGEENPGAQNEKPAKENVSTTPENETSNDDQPVVNEKQDEKTDSKKVASQTTEKEAEVDKKAVQ